MVSIYYGVFNGSNKLFNLANSTRETSGTTTVSTTATQALSTSGADAAAGIKPGTVRTLTAAEKALIRERVATTQARTGEARGDGGLSCLLTCILSTLCALLCAQLCNSGRRG